MYLPYSEACFFDDFSESDTVGLYSTEHIIYIALIFSAIVFALYLSKNVDRWRYVRIHTALAVILTLLEGIKIFSHATGGSHPDNWIPFYFCGLFLFAIWFAKSGSPTLSAVGFSYITMGGIAAGAFYILYPSTSLAVYPILHPEIFYAALYHAAMVYFGILTLKVGAFKPRSENIKHYSLFITAACLLSLPVNSAIGTNCMFLRDPFGLPLLSPLCEHFPILYMLLVWFGQAVLLYKFSFFIYKKTTKHLSSSNNENQDTRGL